MQEIFKKLKKQVVPVVVLKSLEKIDELCKFLLHSNVFVCEITYRTDCAAEAVKFISTHYPQILVGAGTILSVETAQNAVANGASFLVSPGTNESVISFCNANNIPIIAGVETASEIEKAMSLGQELLKFFPAEAIGGVKKIKALSAPYSNVKFMPTGGITPINAIEYLALDSVWCVGGSYVVPKELLG
ncbi:MAG: bifunctional 4-hydroxy-2-oxoglutarate aldolase/2-dehydro-3-deoxy-phosphogluconate aldolase [Clostridia bacterium]